MQQHNNAAIQKRATGETAASNWSLYWMLSMVVYMI